METFIVIISVIFLGLVFGSFGSVIFYRLGQWPTKKVRKGFLVGRSECPHCHHTLQVRNLIPVFSFLFQGGKCEYCKSPISWFYPFLEFSTVCIFGIIVLMTFKYGIPFYQNLGLQGGLGCTICMSISARLLRLIFLYDIKTYELHITATVFLFILSLFCTLFFSINKLQILLGIGIFALIFLGIYYLGKLIVYLKYKKNAEGFGLGDVILAPILGARLVFFIQPSGIFERCYLISFFIILSCLVGLIYFGVELFIIKVLNYKLKKNILFKRSPIIPFLPAMILGFLIELILWNNLVGILL